MYIKNRKLKISFLPNWLLTGLLGVLLTFSSYAADYITYYHNDALGSPRVATDKNGNVVWGQNYTPYGKQTHQGDTGNSTVFSYTGKALDKDTGLQYFGARWYDPQIGRFMGIDPVGVDIERSIHSFNRYAYANNNPYKYVDPNGELPVLLLVPLIIKGIDAGITAYDSYQAYQAEGTIGVFKTLGTGAALGVLPGGKILSKIGGKVSNVTKGGTTTLYRAVGPDELADIKKTGQLINRGSAEGKYFTNSAEHASDYAKQAVKAFGDQPYTTIKTKVPTSSLPSPTSVDRGIPAYVIPNKSLPL